MLKKLFDYLKKETKNDLPYKPTYTKPVPSYTASTDKKAHAKELIEEAKSQTVEINNSSTVFDFVYSYKEFRRIVKELIRLNEKHGIYMFPPPRRELERAEENIGASINDFISRAIGKIWSSGEQWANDVDFLLDEIEEDNYLSSLLTYENKERISKLRKQANDERKRSALPAPDTSDAETQPISPIDIGQIIQEENEWRRQQRGLSPIEYELEQVDSMDGHAFEHWCARLLEENKFTDVTVTPGSGDQGVDVLAVKDGIHYAFQCKCYSSDLGNTPIQQVYAGKEMYGCQVGVVMTNRYFTAGAKQLAERTKVLLWDRDKLIEMLGQAQ